jgi:hypothetical protein
MMGVTNRQGMLTPPKHVPYLNSEIPGLDFSDKKTLRHKF